MSGSAGIDPNLFASLAAAYTGGINAPSGVEQVGFFPQVNSQGNNLEYVAPFAAALAGYDIKDAAGNTLGRTWAQARKVRTTSTELVTLVDVTIPDGIAWVRWFVLGINGTTYGYYSCDGQASVYNITALPAMVTLVESSTTPPSTSLVGTHLVDYDNDYGHVVINANANVADGTVDWIALAIVTAFYGPGWVAP